jgi:hypothetical protein
MAYEEFKNMRERIFRDHKRLIVKSALNGYKRKGRGFVLVELADTGRLKRLSFLTLNTLGYQPINARRNEQEFGKMLFAKVSFYYPSSEILVVVTDGKHERLSVGSRRARISEI